MVFARRIIVVCGYGCNLDSPLRPYLDRILRFCEAGPPHTVILCGGATQQRSFPDATEAMTMFNYLSMLDRHRCSWYLEDRSYTTYENIRNATAIINRLKAEPWFGREPRHDEIIVFCEATRALEVALLTRHFLGFPPERGEPDIRIETDSWERMHPTKKLIATALTWCAIRFPVINTLRSKARQRKSLMR